MIDWPNLLIGAVVGAVVTAIPWAIDHGLARRARRADVLTAWATAAKQLEILLWTPDTTSADLFRLRASFPIDRWRKTLGPGDFRLLEGVERAFHDTERASLALEKAPDDASLHAGLVTAYEARQDAQEAFSNRSRAMQSESYDEVTHAEERAAIRRAYRSQPIATFKSRRRSRQLRREAGL